MYNTSNNHREYSYNTICTMLIMYVIDYIGYDMSTISTCILDKYKEYRNIIYTILIIYVIDYIGRYILTMMGIESTGLYNSVITDTRNVLCYNPIELT